MWVRKKVKLAENIEFTPKEHVPTFPRGRYSPKLWMNYLTYNSSLLRQLHNLDVITADVTIVYCSIFIYL